jgi:hypothetical protein
MSGRPFNGAPQLRDPSNFLLISFSRLTVFLSYSQPQFSVLNLWKVYVSDYYICFTFSRKISLYYCYFSGKVGFQRGDQELCLTSSPYHFTNTVHFASNERMSWTALHRARSRMKVYVYAGAHISTFGKWDADKAREPTVSRSCHAGVSNTCLLNSALSLSRPRLVGLND